MATHEQIQTVAKHFVIACIWADSEEGTNPRANAKTHAVAYGVCKAFIEAEPALFAEAMAADGYGSHPDAGSPEAAFGHDLWLTSQGAGVGFWDRDELTADDLGDRITAALEKFQQKISISSEQYRGWMYVRAWDRVNLQNLYGY